MRTLLVMAAALALSGCGVNEHRATEAVKKEIKSRLRDPQSAKFEDIRVVTRPDYDGYYVCGTVNAKNAYGGYAGRKGFVGTANFNTGITTVTKDHPAYTTKESFNALWSEICG